MNRHYLVTSMGLLLGVLTLGQLAHAQTPNMDPGLAHLVARFRAGLDPLDSRPSPAGGLTPTYADMALTDAQRRVLVEIYVTSIESLNSVRQALDTVGASITGESREYAQGTFSAYIPFAVAEALGRTPGVSTMALSYRPMLSTGLVNSQGAAVIRSDIANLAGYTGAGITVGVLSDSYDTSPTSYTTIRAANDVNSIDLPTPALKFLADLPTSLNNTDEGRAMLQIVRDVAPAATLCFATAFTGEAGFAANIRKLRTDPLCRADVIVDDVAYFTEPFFSDGQVAQAVNDVANSTILAGKRVTYFSSAGNQQQWGFYASPANFGNPTSIPGINLSTIAACPLLSGSPASARNTAGGFLDFGAGVFTTTMTFSNSQLVMQWDDPFNLPGGITTDLNFLFFNDSGNCTNAVGSDNFSSKQPLELLFLSGGPVTVMIARTAGGTQAATRVKIISYRGVSSPLFSNVSVPTTFGHSAATGAISVAAYRYSSNFFSAPPLFETFSSPGPVTIAIHQSGFRLLSPQTRKKPDIAAPDGVDTTFFGATGILDGTPYRNFFGTSAAAPHAAGVAALMMQKAGGPGTLFWQSVKSYLQNTARPRVMPYTFGLPVKGYSAFDGYGLIDAVDALSKVALPGSTPACPTVPIGQPNPC